MTYRSLALAVAALLVGCAPSPAGGIGASDLQWTWTSPDLPADCRSTPVTSLAGAARCTSVVVEFSSTTQATLGQFVVGSGCESAGDGGRARARIEGDRLVLEGLTCTPATSFQCSAATADAIGCAVLGTLNVRVVRTADGLDLLTPDGRVWTRRMRSR